MALAASKYGVIWQQWQKEKRHRMAAMKNGDGENVANVAWRGRRAWHGSLCVIFLLAVTKAKAAITKRGGIGNNVAAGGVMAA